MRTGVKTPFVTRAISTTTTGSDSASSPIANVSIRILYLDTRTACWIAMRAFCILELSIGSVGIPSVRNIMIRFEPNRLSLYALWVPMSSIAAMFTAVAMFVIPRGPSLMMSSSPFRARR